MELKRKGPEAAEVTTKDGRRVLFSYGEPVAVSAAGMGAARVDGYISRTTEAHIREFLGPNARARKVPRAEIRRLAEEA